MSYGMGMPFLKLNTVGNKGKGGKGKHCGDFSKCVNEALEERIGNDPDIDRSKSYENIYYTFNNGELISCHNRNSIYMDYDNRIITSGEELVKYSNNHIEEISNHTGRNVRSDAVRMVSQIFKPEMAFMQDLNFNEKKQYLEDCLKIYSNLIGKENIKTAVLHLDELNPHLHVFVEPVTPDGRLSCKEIYNSSFLRTLNREMPKQLRALGYDIKDCKVSDLAAEREKIQMQVESWKEEQLKMDPQRIFTGKELSKKFSEFKSEDYNKMVKERNLQEYNDPASAVAFKLKKDQEREQERIKREQELKVLEEKLEDFNKWNSDVEVQMYDQVQKNPNLFTGKISIDKKVYESTVLKAAKYDDLQKIAEKQKDYIMDLKKEITSNEQEIKQLNHEIHNLSVQSNDKDMNIKRLERNLEQEKQLNKIYFNCCENIYDNISKLCIQKHFPEPVNKTFWKINDFLIDKIEPFKNYLINQRMPMNYDEIMKAAESIEHLEIKINGLSMYEIMDKIDNHTHKIHMRM